MMTQCWLFLIIWVSIILQVVIGLQDDLSRELEAICKRASSRHAYYCSCRNRNDSIRIERLASELRELRITDCGLVQMTHLQEASLRHVAVSNVDVVILHGNLTPSVRTWHFSSIGHLLVGRNSFHQITSSLEFHRVKLLQVEEGVFHNLSHLRLLTFVDCYISGQLDVPLSGASLCRFLRCQFPEVMPSGALRIRAKVVIFDDCVMDHLMAESVQITSRVLSMVGSDVSQLDTEALQVNASQVSLERNNFAQLSAGSFRKMAVSSFLTLKHNVFERVLSSRALDINDQDTGARIFFSIVNNTLPCDCQAFPMNVVHTASLRSNLLAYYLNFLVSNWCRDSSDKKDLAAFLTENCLNSNNSQSTTQSPMGEETQVVPSLSSGELSIVFHLPMVRAGNRPSLDLPKTIEVQVVTPGEVEPRVVTYQQGNQVKQPNMPVKSTPDEESTYLTAVMISMTVMIITQIIAIGVCCALIWHIRQHIGRLP